MINENIKIKNSDLDEGTVDDYEELTSIYKLLLKDISKGLRQFERIYNMYKKNHGKLGDLIYLASNKTGSDKWEDYEIKSKSDLLDSKINNEVDGKYIFPIINKQQIVKLSNKEVKKKITEMNRGYTGLKKKLLKINSEISRYTKINNVLLYDIDTIKFLINRKEYV